MNNFLTPFLCWYYSPNKCFCTLPAAVRGAVPREDKRLGYFMGCQTLSPKYDKFFSARRGTFSQNEVDAAEFTPFFISDSDNRALKYCRVFRER